MIGLDLGWRFTLEKMCPADLIKGLERGRLTQRRRQTRGHSNKRRQIRQQLPVDVDGGWATEGQGRHGDGPTTLVSVTEAVGLDVVVGRLLRGEGRLAGGGGELADLQARTLKKMT